MAKGTKSIEEKVEDHFKKQLHDFKIKYFTKTESINSSIDSALANYSSKSGGTGNNYPDIKLLLTTSHQRNIPVMIEAKGRQGDLIKYIGKTNEIDLNPKAVQKYAVNGAVHYVNALLAGGACSEAIAIGINGRALDDGDIAYEVLAYYVSKVKHLYPLKLEEGSDLSFLKENNLASLMQKIDRLNLSEDEYEKLKQDKETELETKIHEIHQAIYDDSNLKAALDTNQKLFLFCGLIMAGLPIDGQSDLSDSDFKGNESGKLTDNRIILNRVESFLEAKKNTSDKIKLVLESLNPVFNNEKLWKSINGESYLKKLFIQVKTQIIPCLTSDLHLDFTGKIFNKLSEWIHIENDIQNDVVLTPRYLTSFMAKLAQTNKDSYVLDSAMGSAGFLVSAMEIMIADAKAKITDSKQLAEKINNIKQQQILGIEILSNIYILAVLNMILMGDGSSRLIQKNSFEYAENFPATVFLLNPPYSADGKGFNFVEHALKRMNKGYGCVLIQENAGSGNGLPHTKEILKNNTLLASIHLPDKVFIGKASVQTAIYLFKVNIPHDPDALVYFIDMSNDGYARQARKKSSQAVNFKDIDHAKQRYQEVLDIIFNKKKKTDFYNEQNGLVIRDTISLDGNDWTFAQHKKIDITPTIDDFKTTVKDYLAWKISQIIQNGDHSCLGKM